MRATPRTARSRRHARWDLVGDRGQRERPRRSPDADRMGRVTARPVHDGRGGVLHEADCERARPQGWRPEALAWWTVATGVAGGETTMKRLVTWTCSRLWWLRQRFEHMAWLASIVAHARQLEREERER